MPTNGRPLALSEQKKAKIIALLAAGCSKFTAASAVNCHPQTIANTAKRDPQFAERLAAAEHTAELVHLRNINNAAADVKYWRASAWMLERLRPETFARQAPNSISPLQLAALIQEIATIVVQEIPVAAFRKQVLKRFDCLLDEARQQRGQAPFVRNTLRAAARQTEPVPANRGKGDSPICVDQPAAGARKDWDSTPVVACASDPSSTGISTPNDAVCSIK